MKHGEGVGLLITNHEKGVEFFLVPKSAVGRFGNVKMKHGEGFAVPKIGWEGFRKGQHEPWKGVWVFHGFQGWGGVGRVWEALKWSTGRGLGCPCFPRMGWKVVRKGLAPCPGRRMFQDSYWGTCLKPILAAKWHQAPNQILQQPPNPVPATPNPNPTASQLLAEVYWDFQGENWQEPRTKEGSKTKHGKGFGHSIFKWEGTRIIYTQIPASHFFAHVSEV